MQVTQTSSQGLKQEYKVVLPAGELAAKLAAQLSEIQAKSQIKGFRPGKAPIGHLKKLYGKSIMSDVLQEAVNDANRKIVEENELRIALEPKIDFPGGQEEVERALTAEGDFSYVVTFETLPKFDIGAFDDISLERPVAEVARGRYREGAAVSRRSCSGIRGQARRGQGREGRQTDDRFHRQARRRAL